MIGEQTLLTPTAVRRDWETPQPLFHMYDREFHFTLDVCANYQNRKCHYYIDEQENGLLEDWADNVCWMNPPYGRQLRRWMKKAYEASVAGATVVCLVPARTDTQWWHEYAEKGERRFLMGRVAFIRPDGKRSRAPFPSAIVIFRPGSQ
jgi:site-specific DNA-methyltransferase (adenine-specific)